MKLITISSRKGGVGKTTTALCLTSALIALGKRVILLDSDNNGPLVTWKQRADANGNSSDLLQVTYAPDTEMALSVLADASETGVEFAIVDTHGDLSETHITLISASDLTIIPTGAKPLDVEQALDSFTDVLDVVDDMETEAKVKILRRGIPTGKTGLSVVEKAALNSISQLPQFATTIHLRNSYLTMTADGLLGRIIERLECRPSTKLMAAHHRTAFGECKKLAAEVIEYPGIQS